MNDYRLNVAQARVELTRALSAAIDDVLMVSLQTSEDLQQDDWDDVLRAVLHKVTEARSNLRDALQILKEGA